MVLRCRGRSGHFRWRSLRREALDRHHGAATVAADTDIDPGYAQKQVLPGRLCLRSAGSPDGQQQRSTLAQLFAAPVAENTVVADFDESVGQNVEQEPSHELKDVQAHRSGMVVVTRCSVPEPNVCVVVGDQAMVRDGNAVGVPTQIGHDVFGIVERRLAVDDPFFPVEVVQEPGIECQLSAPKQMPEFVEELAAKEPRHHLDRQEEIISCRFPPAICCQAPTGDDTVHVGVIRKGLGPRVKNHRKADLGAQMLRVTTQLAQRRRCGFEQDVVEESLVPQHDRSQLLRNCEDDVGVGDR